MGLIQTVKSIKPAFWLANGQEACERLAYFGIRAILPLMMVSTGLGGLGLSMGEKGAIFGIWALIQCIIPMVSGGFSESFGYKKSLIVAFIINTVGYLLMANILNIASLFSGDTLNTTLNFWLMMIAGCTIGVGTAIFKPPVGGIVAQSLNEKNSGFGFGLFYWVVNIGGFLAPMLASALRGTDEAPTWSYVFYGAAFVTLFNLVITLLFFKDPKPVLETKSEEQASTETVTPTAEEIIESATLSVQATDETADVKTLKSDDAPNTTSEPPVSLVTEKTTEDTKTKKSAGQVFVETLSILWHDKAMLLFLLIVSGFWLMFMQLWDLLPNFLEEWTDRRAVGQFLGQYSIFESFLESNGALKPEMIINIDSAAIILLVLPLSALFSRYKMMTALVLGMVISVIGFVMSGLTMSGGLACLAIFIFAIGEIICSPKFDEYVGMTAPEDKKAIYMGFVNIPFAIGWAVGNFLSGPLYEVLSSKTTLATQFLVEHGETEAALVDLDQTKLMDKVMQQIGTTDPFAATQVLWDTYHPWTVWIFLGAIGVVSMIGMIVFYYKSGMYEKDKAAALKSKENSSDSEPKEPLDDATAA